jgi:hypothetical protein
LLGLLLQPAPGHADGVTIITHGYNPSVATTPLWMASMRDAISTNYLNGAQNYGTITVTGSAGNLVATCSPWNVGLSGGTNGDILIVLDWSAVADSLTTSVTAQSVAAVVVNDIVTGQNGQRPLAELPIHLIGHSRGGGLICELARLLGNYGVVVDQLTPLDPHPLTASDPQPLPPTPAVIDTPAAIYQNVVFADVYIQTNAYPMGEYLSGGYNRIWASLIGGYNNNAAPYNTYAEHRNVLLLYQGTITLTNPVYNGEATMGATERAAWYNTYEAAGTNTGFTYSRLEGSGVRSSANTPVAGGDGIVAGLNNASVFGGSGARSSLAWSSAVWPNVAQLQVVSNGTALGSGTYQIPIGTTLQLPYVYLDYSNGCTVTLHVDTDRNPYNSNDVAVLSTNACAATGATYTQGTINWNTAGMSPQAAVYVYAEVTDGTHTRYFYAAPQLALVQPPPAVTITNTVTSVPATQATIVISGTNNAYVTGTMFYTNAATGASGSFSAQPAWSTPAITLAYGTNMVTVTGTNSGGVVASASISISRGAPSVMYVAANGANVWPYATWAGAATTIQAAVNAMAAGGTVWVSNGVYAAGGAFSASPAISNRVVISQAITLQSVNGPAVTFIAGAPDPSTGGLGTNATRCVFMSSGLLSGFTLTNGYTRADSDWNYQEGGGGALVTGGLISNCVAAGCFASHFGGGVDLFGGDAWNSILVGNTAYDGGGLKVQGDNAFNCLVYGNHASDSGGGAYFWQGGTLYNCTVAGNTATNQGGGVYCYQGGTNLNTILFSNTVAGSVSNYTTNAGGLFQYCCTTPNPGGTSNITSNPLFVNAAAGDFQLASNSPCINAGNNAYAEGATDLDGNPRIIGGVVDMGAYESTNGATTNGIPWGWLLQYGLATDGSADMVDSDGDGFNNLQEYIAGTNPTNSASYFHITGVTNLPPWTVFFQSSSNRLYTLYSRTNAAIGSWLAVPGQTNVPGPGGPFTLSDTNAMPFGRFYRISVQLP